MLLSSFPDLYYPQCTVTMTIYIQSTKMIVVIEPGSLCRPRMVQDCHTHGVGAFCKQVFTYPIAWLSAAISEDESNHDTCSKSKPRVFPSSPGRLWIYAQDRVPPVAAQTSQASDEPGLELW
jgi:hypothetical protein